ncbi:hypothetical protein JAAARDRAFT_35831 [Jaapia argillacea MUCL 33604]|uniref:Uncharacterized protein n=1 Tax=Jaapia argillacea MUCL 33604 TaxID=933084 RepID=A0A067Q146_9AGAM|nr:hypothetical protein JAAARDRAFT_35831 [Jaapia argillacea MUCL 33604]
MEIQDGIPKWEGHKGDTRLMEEISDAEGTMPKYKGKKEDGVGAGTGEGMDGKW